MAASTRDQFGWPEGSRSRVHGKESEHVLSKDWDHHLFRLGEDLASAYLDLDIAAAAPLAEHSHCVRISVALRQPAQNGMSTDEEFDDLIALEDDLIAQLEGADVIYVGRLTARGSRLFYFYCTNAELLARDASAAMHRHPAYQHEISGRADPNWSTYFDLLYPSPETYQRMQNRRLN